MTARISSSTREADGDANTLPGGEFIHIKFKRVISTYTYIDANVMYTPIMYTQNVHLLRRGEYTLY